MSSEAILARYGDSHECLAPSKTDEDRLMAAAGIWKDAYGRRFLLQPKRLSDLSHGEMPLAEAQTLISRITRQPILCGSAGHTTLLTEFTYVDGVFSRLQIRGGTVRDPWSGSENLRPLSDEELKTPAYLIALSIRPLP
ncbi:MAG: hypothetical protein OIF40_05800 [Mangrovicoccus sp.]|nr:hypothetical protein [Mangrovicoccus sp.]